MALLKQETMIFTNPTDYTIKLEAIGHDPVAPGADVELPLELCAPTRKDNGERGKSPVEQVAPQLHPKHPADHEAWKQTPAPAKGESKIVTVAARAASESPGVKALRDAAAAQAAKAAPVAQTKKV